VSQIQEAKLMMRKVIGLLLTTFFLASAHPADAQQTGKTHRIGFLSGGFPGPAHWTAILRTELQQLGYVEGRNIAIESRFTENKIDRLPALADELVRLKLDVIVTGGTNDARAAKNATKSIPIVGVGLQDPVALGLVDSLARPGGNLTGFTTITEELSGKRLELLKETVANLSRVALLWSPQFPGSARAWEENKAAARNLGLQLHFMGVHSADKFRNGIQRCN
jgi:putative ABC transport system substrate-binding protein